MTTARPRNASAARKSTRTSRPVSSPARATPDAETLADAALGLRKALGETVGALTGLASQRMQRARDLVVRRADEARQILDHSVKTVEARVLRVVESQRVQSVRDAAEAAVRRVTRSAQQEVATARQAARRVTRDASAQVRAAQKAVRREFAVAEKAVRQPISAVQARVKAAAKPARKAPVTAPAKTSVKLTVKTAQKAPQKAPAKRTVKATSTKSAKPTSAAVSA